MASDNQSSRGGSAMQSAGILRPSSSVLHFYLDQHVNLLTDIASKRVDGKCSDLKKPTEGQDSQSDYPSFCRRALDA
ncbi:hypothetical protein CSKR_201885 [Clonorchis sinensis]|uniref:Uncharacterized protein n=1 Tax=Clonorchis sinensis TaxID=79923 RepID=A0A8T1MYQ3_CLOSI|nr:hypothetical protein CSKR_201885 [Clonorchis sinensis]